MCVSVLHCIAVSNVAACCRCVAVCVAGALQVCVSVLHCIAAVIARISVLQVC